MSKTNDQSQRDPGDAFPFHSSGLSSEEVGSTKGRWYGWINAMPPGPARAHIIGDVVIVNPGIQAMLTLACPQGINPAVLIVDLHLVQQPGIWPTIVTTVQARFDRTLFPGSTTPTSAQIRLDGQTIATISELPVAS